MECLGLTVTTSTASKSSYFSIAPIPIYSFSIFTRRRVLKAQNFSKYPNKFSVFASKDEPKLDPLDQMELKFGRMLGEDPKLTLAKVTFYLSLYLFFCLLLFLVQWSLIIFIFF